MKKVKFNYKNQDEIFKILKNIYWDQGKQCFNKYLPKWEKTNIFNEGNPEESKKEYVEELIDYYYGSYDYFLMNTTSQPSRKFWVKQRYNNPSQLTFWFDFLDAENSELHNVSNQVLGNRKKSLHDNNIKRVFYENIPEVIFKSSDSKIQNNLNYTVINLPADLQSLFTISSKSKSAKEVIEELLYKHSCTLSTISITAIPVYYLEPNHKILVRDDKSNINGEYIINKISYSLNYNSLMTIEAMKFYEEF